VDRTALVDPHLVAPLRSEPARAAVLSDFDGTLAPIVADPADARPGPGAVEVLGALAERYAVVAVVSGRPVSFLIERLGDSGGAVVLSGLYGLEEARRDASGRWDVRRAPESQPWEPVVRDVVREATAAAPPGVVIEPKGLSLTVHWRNAPQHAAWVAGWVDQAAARSGLVVHAAKASAELRLPIDRDKGSVVRELTTGLEVACFLGDDVGDIPAFDALAELPGSTLAVAVRSAETPAVLIERAGLVVDGDAGAVAFLRLLSS
jgi:trehalose 6-phosphate phosphatase